MSGGEHATHHLPGVPDNGTYAGRGDLCRDHQWSARVIAGAAYRIARGRQTGGYHRARYSRLSGARLPLRAECCRHDHKARRGRLQERGACMERRLIECVPNFSEGRDTKVVDAIRDAIAGTPGVALLACESDPDHNRSVITFAGAPEAVRAGALRGIEEAVRRINLTRHE